VSSAVIDDQSLRAIALADPVPTLSAQLGGQSIWTTFGWYHRLCMGFARPEGAGRLGGVLASMPRARRRQAIAAVAELPDDVNILSGRVIAWPMAVLRQRHAPAIRLNFLAAEPLAAATLLGPEAVIVIAEGNVPPSLAAAAEREGIPVRTVPMG
jgi:hypothetical protein